MICQEDKLPDLQKLDFFRVPHHLWWDEVISERTDFDRNGVTDSRCQDHAKEAGTDLQRLLWAADALAKS